MTDPEEFRRQREEKIMEIRRTGKTWQWPDMVQHQKWTPAHVLTLALIAVAVAAILVIVLG